MSAPLRPLYERIDYLARSHPGRARAHIEAQLVDGRWHDAWGVLGAADDLTLDAMLDAAKLLASRPASSRPRISAARTRPSGG